MYTSLQIVVIFWLIRLRSLEVLNFQYLGFVMLLVTIGVLIIPLCRRVTR